MIYSENARHAKRKGGWGMGHETRNELGPYVLLFHAISGQIPQRSPFSAFPDSSHFITQPG